MREAKALTSIGGCYTTFVRSSLEGNFVVAPDVGHSEADCTLCTPHEPIFQPHLPSRLKPTNTRFWVKISNLFAGGHDLGLLA